jgi:hypothetical protein
MNSYERRKILIDEMKKLEQANITCSKCAGHCCTYEKNSMMVTPLEAQDIFSYLKENNRLNHELHQKLSTCIQDFRLNHPMPGNGKRSFMRRTYTCPFFKDQHLGCSLPVEIKPYGCLGFNPTTSGEVLGKDCNSNQKLLIERESFGMSSGEKKSIPVALMDLWETL